MRLSLRKKIEIVYICLMTATMLVCWIVNTTLMQSYYEKDKRNAVENTYEKLNEAAIDGILETEEFQDEMRAFANRHNIEAEVINANSELVFGATISGDELMVKLFSYVLPIPFSSIDKANLKENQVFISLDQRMKKETMEMYGQLATGEWYIITSPIESIKDSVGLANRFIAYVGFAAVLIGATVCWWVTKKIADPILELARISERMTHLDFEAKYQGNDHNEVGLLGRNINKLSSSLEKTISELKTANNELQKDIEKKEQIDEMRKEFLSNVSHELKTPIALIQGYAEGLKEGIYDDDQSKDYYCEVIVDEASKMNNMVQRLLTLNQLEFSNEVTTMERFDIVSLIQNYLQSRSILAKQDGIEVRFANTDPIFVWADEFKVEEVFANYYTNAVHYCSGKKVIDIKVVEMDGKVRISVFNTGNPIPEESIPHIWEKFYKVDKARTREYGGNGVGLSIVKAIMESFNQGYGVTNYSNGVLFWFELETVKEYEEV